MTVPRIVSLTAGSLAIGLACGVSSASAMSFSSTNDPSAWQVSVSQGGADGQESSFSTANFQAAVAVTGRLTSDGTQWISNNATGTNACCVGTWTFFVFRQSFTLTPAEAATASLQFQWAADDSGEGFASRGSWTPKYSLNGGSLVNGVWDTGYTYDLGHLTTVGSGFVAGVNTLDFYVEGNGVSDGFALKTVAVVPEPETYALMLAGLVVLGFLARRHKA